MTALFKQLMQRRFLSVSIPVLLGFLSISSGSQAQISLKGTISDSTDFKLEFVAVILKKDSTILTGAYTDSLGNYELTIPSRGNYTVLYRYSGFNTIEQKLLLSSDTTINIVMRESFQNIEGVEVKYTIPIVEKKIDRLIYNPSTLASNNGTNAYDVLSRTPTVTTDEGGGVSIKGISGAGVMIDGRLLQMSNEQRMEYLKSISSEEIHRIEIIANPSSKYDSEGISGLVNIILSRSLVKGITGHVSAGYEQTIYPSGSLSADFNYRSEKVNIFGGTSFNLGRTLLNENVSNTFNRTLDPYYYSEVNERLQNDLSSFNRVGIDYFITPKQTIGLRTELSFNQKNGHRSITSDFFQNTSSIDSTYFSYVELEQKNQTLTTNLNYVVDLDSSGRSFSVDLDYMYYTQPLRTTINMTDKRVGSTLFYNDVVFSNEANQAISLYSAKADYYHPINEKMYFDLGVKSYSVTTNNRLDFFNFENNQWAFDAEKSSDFNYTESNFAGYFNFSHQATEKFSYQVGIRNEYTVLKGESTETIEVPNRTYNRPFPSVFLQYAINDSNQVSLSYSQRINRPGFSNLNPFKYYLSPTSYIVGDPFLLPAFTHSFSLSYLLNQNFYFDAYCNLTEGEITQIVLLDTTTNSYQTISTNLDKTYSYGLSTYFNLSPFEWWQTSFNINAGLSAISTSVDNSLYTRTNFNVFTFNSNRFTLSKKGKMYLESVFYYQPKGSIQGTFILGRIMELSLHLSKTFNNKATLTISGLDLLNSTYVSARVDEPSQFTLIDGSYNRRGVRVSFSYKFGKKSIQKERTKDNAVKDEKDRL